MIKSERTQDVVGVPATTSQPIAIVGITIVSKLFACFAKYDFGNSTPIANNPVARTILITSSVISFDFPQERGSKTPAK